ncbi:hypothetical protein FRC03_006023 [Tulasnella sp. 419]|nr:hypothetical protein FRC03_006023 [Tulasnella sp. 419]
MTTSKLLPRLQFAKNPAQFTVRRRVSPQIIPTSDDSIKVNKEVKQAEHVNNEEESEGEYMSLKALVENRCPSLRTPYVPCWWMPTGHAQTAYIVMADFNDVDPVIYKRTLLRLPDGGTIGLDFTPPNPPPDQDPTAPVIVVLHGLSGGSHESYVRSILHTACSPKEKGGMGYRGVVVNFRGCAGVPLTSPQFYSAGYTDDIRTALLYLSTKYPKAPLLGIGFSLGAGVLTRYLGEEGERSRLKAGVVLACPWNIVANSKQLEGRWLNREIYSRAMGSNVLALFKSHVDTIKSFPDSLIAKEVPAIMQLKNPQLKEVDEHMVRVAGGSIPPFPFDTADDYYEWAGSHHKLPGIRVPFLAINSIDDPIVAEIPFEEAEKNPWVCLVTTAHGGHLGWFEGALSGRDGKPPHRWVKKPVLEWFAAAVDIMDKVGAGSGVDVGNPRETKNGFVVEVGHPFVGYKVISTGMEVKSGKAKLLKGL